MNFLTILLVWRNCLNVTRCKVHIFFPHLNLFKGESKSPFFACPYVVMFFCAPFRCFGLLISPGRNVQHSDMQLIELVSELLSCHVNTQFSVSPVHNPHKIRFTALELCKNIPVELKHSGCCTVSYHEFVCKV